MASNSTYKNKQIKMKRRFVFRVTTLIVISATIFYALFMNITNDGSNIKAGNKAPDFKLTQVNDNNGKSYIQLSELKGKGDSDDELQFDPPSLDDLDPDDPMTEYIEYGNELFSESNTVMPDHVGNELSCASCHANGGMAQANSMVGVMPNFPEYNQRAGVVFTIEDRINGCMVRSMNGEMLEEDSKEMRSMVAFFTYISEGIEIGEEIPWRNPSVMPEVPEPDVVQGEELYETMNCMSCHAADGSGTGANTGPAVWGDNSFNDGAGMARLTKAAGYIQDNMPPGQGNTLSDQEAADLAAYMLSHPRPEFDGHDEDWPNGRPTDIIDAARVEQIQNGTFDWTEIENVIPKDE